MWDAIRIANEKKEWAKLVWGKMHVPKSATCLYRAINDFLQQSGECHSDTYTFNHDVFSITTRRKTLGIYIYTLNVNISTYLEMVACKTIWPRGHTEVLSIKTEIGNFI